MTTTACCPWCKYRTTTYLPMKLPFISFRPAAYWSGVKLGYHAILNHPLLFDQFRDEHPVRMMEWYMSQPYLEVKAEYEDMTAEEIIDSLTEEEVHLIIYGEEGD